MKVEIQSESSAANSLTGRLGAGSRTKHMDTRYFWVLERIQDGDLTVKQRRIVRMCERSRSLRQYSNNITHMQNWCSINRGPHTPLPELIRRRKMKVKETKTETDSVFVAVVNIATDAKLSEILQEMEKLSNSHDERTMMGAEAKRECAKQATSASKTQQATGWALTDRNLTMT